MVWCYNRREPFPCRCNRSAVEQLRPADAAHILISSRVADDECRYPNADALRKGLDIYRHEMSEFVVRVLRQKPGSRLEQAVAASLTDRQRQDFTNKMQENGGDVPRSIEIGFIPTWWNGTGPIYSSANSPKRTLSGTSCAPFVTSATTWRTTPAGTTSRPKRPKPTLLHQRGTCRDQLPGPGPRGPEHRALIRDPAPVRQSQPEPTAPAAPAVGLP